MSRRKLITGLTAFIAAPAIIRVADLMPIRSLENYSITLGGNHVFDQPMTGTEILARQRAHDLVLHRRLNEYLSSLHNFQRAYLNKLVESATLPRST